MVCVLFLSLSLSLSLCVQAKPFAVLPGSGMAIEIVLKSTDKVGDTPRTSFPVLCSHFIPSYNQMKQGSGNEGTTQVQ